MIIYILISLYHELTVDKSVTLYFQIKKHHHEILHALYHRPHWAMVYGVFAKSMLRVNLNWFFILIYYTY